MTNQHPITPPLELVHQWVDMLSQRSDHHVFSLAAQWGADMELEACCEYMQHEDFHGFATELRAARRPKPPSLKKQALSLLNKHNNGWAPSPKQWQIIRLAVEALSE